MFQEQGVPEAVPWGTQIYSLMEYSSIRGGGGQKLRFPDSIKLEITLWSQGGRGCSEERDSIKSKLIFMECKGRGGKA